jgi:Asp-tRNA(Asn)/Glu-tRNA(Gln) amidotransferase B subunit
VVAAKAHTAFIAPATPKTEVDQVIKLVSSELQDLLRQRAVIIRRVAILRRTIAGLAEMIGGDALSEELLVLIAPRTRGTRGTGLTEACRSVLSNSSQPLTTREVVERIRANNGAVIRNHKDPVASVTSILHRLGSYGESTTQLSKSGRRIWVAVKNPL